MDKTNKIRAIIASVLIIIIIATSVMFISGLDKNSDDEFEEFQTEFNQTDPVVVSQPYSDCDCDSMQSKIDELMGRIKTLKGQVPNPSPKTWDGDELGLPEGIVQHTDCAGRTTANKNSADNYITIKKPDGVSTIVRDVDEDTYLNLKKGDIIQ